MHGRRGEDKDLAPRECQKYACAIQTCIVRFDKKPDPVEFCRPHYHAYEDCIRKRNERLAAQRERTSK